MMKIFKLFWILLFCIGMIVPLLHINTAEITNQENRTLAKFPEIKKNGFLNINYGKDFESWLADRFWGRDQLINIRFFVSYKINGQIENKKAFIGDDGWMFEKSNTINIPSIEKQKKKIKNDVMILKKFANKFKGKNIPIFLVIIPDRAHLYQKHWERYYKPKSRLNYAAEITKLLKDSSIMVINPQNKLIKAMEKGDIFYKDDMHLTPFGMDVLLNEVYFSLKQKGLEGIKLPPFSKNLEHTAAIAAMLGLAGKIKVKENNYNFEHPDSQYKEIKTEKYNIIQEAIWSGRQTLYRLGRNDKASINKVFASIGVCYSEDIFNLFKDSFRYSHWIRTNVELHGMEAIKNSVEKIKELFNLKSNSGIIIITDTNFDRIREALD